MRKTFLHLLVAFGLIGSASAAIFTPIELGANANTSLSKMTLHGEPTESYLPDFNYGSSTSLGGVPFNLPSTGNNVWDSKIPTSWGSGTTSINMDCNVNNCIGAYTLINLFWGSSTTSPLLAVTLNFDDGTSFSKSLFNGVDVRDYNNPDSPFGDNINGTSTVNVYAGNNTVIDRQFIDLSGTDYYGKNLTSFSLVDSGDAYNSNVNNNGYPYLQRSFLTGVTIASLPDSTAPVPEPSQVAASILLIGGIAGFMIVRRRQNAAALVA